MLFPTAVFAIFFLIVFFGNWLLAGRGLWRKWFLLGASYIFYGWWNWRFLILIIGCSVVNHTLAVVMETAPGHYRRRLLATAVIFNLGVLGFFKYYKFFVLSAYSVLHSLHLSCQLPLLDIVLPVGISFFTFQALSYVIDVYRRDISPAESLLDFSVYLAFFPQLVAGPIVRARILLPQFRNSGWLQHIDAGRASTLILVGLFKKVVVANSLASLLVEPVFDDPLAYSAPDVLLGVYGYAAQIYCDFSAYSDIAIGVALLLGFHFPLNFNAPYFAVSFRDFWHRWHISLSSWLRDYLYIPLGGSHNGRLRTYRNLLITFLLGGLWHGAQWKFVAWGGLHGLYLALERLLGGRLTAATPKRWQRLMLRGLSLILVFNLVCLAWVFFRAADFRDAWELLGRLKVWQSSQLLSLSALLMLGIGFGVQALDGGRMAPVWDWLNRQSFLLQGALAAVILTLILGLGPRGVAPFIYFQF